MGTNRIELPKEACPKCGNPYVHWRGHAIIRHVGRVRRLTCPECGHVYVSRIDLEEKRKKLKEEKVMRNAVGSKAL